MSVPAHASLQFQHAEVVTFGLIMHQRLLYVLLCTIYNKDLTNELSACAGGQEEAH